MRVRSVVLGVSAAALLTAAVAGCGGSSPPARDSPPAPTSRPAAEARATAVPGPAVVRGVSVSSVERALLEHGGPPPPTTAHCRGASSAERAAGPFGRTRLPLFTCQLTVVGEHASYLVQVLRNGCYVAERKRVGMAVYGCGADRT